MHTRNPSSYTAHDNHAQPPPPTLRLLKQSLNSRTFRTTMPLQTSTGLKYFTHRSTQCKRTQQDTQMSLTMTKSMMLTMMAPTMTDPLSLTN